MRVESTELRVENAHVGEGGGACISAQVPARSVIKIDLSSLSSEPVLGSASASLYVFWPAVMLQYSMQVADP